MNEVIRVYQEDGTYIDRAPTAEEIQQNEKDHQEWLLKKQQEEESQVRRQELLNRLGITDEEASLLMGGI